MTYCADKAALWKTIARKLRGSCAAAALTVLATTSAFAVPVTYIFRGDFEGAINGVPVSGPLTISASGDTDGVQRDKIAEVFGGVGSYYSTEYGMSVLFDLAGYGSFSASPMPASISTMGNYNIIFGLGPQLSTVTGFRIFSGSSGVYDLLSFESAGPFSLEYQNVFPGLAETGAGLLQFDNISNVTFQAVIGTANAVPEPDSFSLFCGAWGALLLTARRRKLAQRVN
ncbi:MAG: hypothetical protein JWP29_866 [Rhodoferax sp.]|nr:hypothetical protein [Rhodoferax sp.]